MASDSTPLISVCIAVYNGERYIAAQLQSILQSPLIGEILVSDDGSTDTTRDVVASFEDPRIRLLPGPRDGLTRNFEFLLSATAGQHIFLSDQDDVWMPDKVERMLAELSHADLVVSDCMVVDQNLNVLESSYFALIGARPGLLKNIAKNSYLGCCMALNRRLLHRILPFPDPSLMHDWWIGLVTEMFGTVSFLRVPLLKYRRHDGNASSATRRSTAALSDRLLRRLRMVRALMKLRLKRSS